MHHLTMLYKVAKGNNNLLFNSNNI